MPSSAVDEDLWSPTRIALKTNQKDITQKKEGVATILTCNTLSQPITRQCYQFSSSYSIRLPSYGLHKNSLIS